MTEEFIAKPLGQQVLPLLALDLSFGGEGAIKGPVL